MFNRLALGFMAATFALTGAASALEVKRTIEIKGDAAKVWSQAGAWCGLADWHPAIAKCEEKTEGEKKMRTLTTKDGGVIKETMTKSAETSYSYQIDESPLPVSNYKATFAVVADKKSKDGSSVVWTADFDPKGNADDAKKVIDGIFSSGLDALKKKVEG
jgi:hypothetical protein